jgi:hypothetical protein
MFNEQMQLRDRRVHVSDRPGLCFSLGEQAQHWTVERCEVGKVLDDQVRIDPVRPVPSPEARSNVQHCRAMLATL